jgi:trans-aconitate methyltransferase
MRGEFGVIVVCSGWFGGMAVSSPGRSDRGRWPARRVLTVGLSEDDWSEAGSYDRFMGRWSREVAKRFLEWIEPPPRAAWLEIGCGTGALTEAILQLSDPASILAVEPSEALIKIARERIRDPRVRFLKAEDSELGTGSSEFQAVVSGLVLNFVEDPHALINSAARRLADGGLIGAYVWDYSEGMEFLRIFWDVAVALDQSAADSDQGSRFPICAPGPLKDLFRDSGLRDVEVASLEIETVFSSFSDYWEPFLGGIGGAPLYIKRLGDDHRSRLAGALRDRLVPQSDSAIELRARAWGVRGSV